MKRKFDGVMLQLLAGSLLLLLQVRPAPGAQGQMRALLERQGLIVELDRSLVFDAYGNSSPRMVIVGRKPNTGTNDAGKRTAAIRFKSNSIPYA